MWFHRNVTSFGRLLLAGILAGDGVRAMVTREVYGKLRGAGFRPALTGLPVLLLGLAEFLLGAWLLYRLWRATRHE